MNLKEVIGVLIMSLLGSLVMFSIIGVIFLPIFINMFFYNSHNLIPGVIISTIFLSIIIYYLNKNIFKM